MQNRGKQIRQRHQKIHPIFGPAAGSDAEDTWFQHVSPKKRQHFVERMCLWVRNMAPGQTFQELSTTWRTAKCPGKPLALPPLPWQSCVRRWHESEKRKTKCGPQEPTHVSSVFFCMIWFALDNVCICPVYILKASVVHRMICFGLRHE